MPTSAASGRALVGDCVQGFTEPEPGSGLYRRALAIMGRALDVPGGLRVEEMRYFVGPDSPVSDKAYATRIQRWYVKGVAGGDSRYRGRWLVEARGVFGSGVVAVAPYHSEGFRSPDWVGFQYEGAESGGARIDEPTDRARRYRGLPGRWLGTPYDFVDGGEGLNMPGLPRQVVGCLEGT
jgi:hypothetical protein